MVEPASKITSTKFYSQSRFKFALLSDRFDGENGRTTVAGIADMIRQKTNFGKEADLQQIIAALKPYGVNENSPILAEILKATKQRKQNDKNKTVQYNIADLAQRLHDRFNIGKAGWTAAETFRALAALSGDKAAIAASEPKANTTAPTEKFNKTGDKVK